MASTIKLSWNPPAEADGGSAEEYKIYRVQDDIGASNYPNGAAVISAAGGVHKTVAHSGAATDAQNFDDNDSNSSNNGPDFGKKYVYSIVASNEAGDGPASAPDDAQA